MRGRLVARGHLRRHLRRSWVQWLFGGPLGRGGLRGASGPKFPPDRTPRAEFTEPLVKELQQALAGSFRRPSASSAARMNCSRRAESGHFCQQSWTATATLSGPHELARSEGVFGSKPVTGRHNRGFGWSQRRVSRRSELDTIRASSTKIHKPASDDFARWSVVGNGRR